MKTLFKKLSALKTVFRPHRCLGVLTLIIGCVFLKPLLLDLYDFVPQARGAFTGWKDLISTFGLLTLPQVVLGIAIVLMSIGLLLRARVAWSFTLILLIAVALFNFLLHDGSRHIGYLSLLDCLCLLWFWREFSQSSLAAGTLFALISFASLLTYALSGSLYLGDEFHPVINRTLNGALFFHRKHVHRRLWRYRARHRVGPPVYRIDHYSGYHRLRHVDQRHHWAGDWRQSQTYD